MDLEALGERTVTVDTDVLQADAGTRTTATGGFVALADVMAKLLSQGVLERSPIRNQIAAVSVGLLREPFRSQLCRRRCS